MALCVRAWAPARTAKLDPALLRDVELVPPHARYMLVRNEDLYAALPSSLPAHVLSKAAEEQILECTNRKTKEETEDDQLYERE